MTVGTLRAMLEGLPEDMAVVAHSGNFELNEAILSATARVTMMTEVLESFRDAFDGTDYSQKVWHYRLRPNTTQQSVLFITPLEKARTLDDSRTEMLAAIFSDHCELRQNV
ncbi:MAG: hypothetical protein M1318_08620 [Firmicutes bacterium]|nr:hypothetical protein [Bacillota bacterium]